MQTERRFNSVFVLENKQTSKQNGMLLTYVTVVPRVRREAFTSVVILQIHAISIWHARIRSAFIDDLLTCYSCKTSFAGAIEVTCRIISIACTSILTGS